MVNFIFNTDKYDKIGIKYRYQDFNSFLKDYKIEYSISNACQKHCFNIVDLFYTLLYNICKQRIEVKYYESYRMV